MKLAKVKLYRLYVDPFCKYDDPKFNEFSIVHERNKLFSLIWASHGPPIELYVPSHLTFNIVGQQYGLHHCGCFVDGYVHMHMADQIAMFETVKVACSEVVSNLCSELSHKFPYVEIMATFGMVYL